MKKFFLRPFLPRDELDIVHQQNVDRAETVAETDHAIEAQGIEHFVGEFLRADVGEPRRGIPLLDQVADRLHQVRLAHAHAAIEKQRIVSLGGLLGDCLRGGVRNGLTRPPQRNQIGSADSAGDPRNRNPGEFASRISRRYGLIFRAHELKMRIAHAHFGQHGLQQLTVGFHAVCERAGKGREPQVCRFRCLPGGQAETT